jgi:molybdopterin synthase sulfur carrier subunit
MKIELLFFAQIREAFGTGSEEIDVKNGATVDDVVTMLRQRDEWRKVARLPVSFAVNERVVDGGRVLEPGDRLVLLTPVSGG